LMRLTPDTVGFKANDGNFNETAVIEYIFTACRETSR